MKNYYTLLLLVTLLCSSNIWAAKISEQQALQYAIDFLKGKNFGGINTPRQLKSKAQTSQDRNYFVFNTEEQDGGFVIVAADDRVPIILGYSTRGTLNLSTAPCNLQWLLNYYDNCIGSLNSESAEFRTNTNSTRRADIAPLIATQWGQTSPFNNLCPKMGSVNCLTGCVATSMAQVINYNRWPQNQTSAVDAYVSNRFNIIMPELPPTQFNWDNMIEPELARLMLYCGQSVKMDYGVTESGALVGDIAPALTEVFGFSKNTHTIYRNDFNEEEWEQIIYQELSEGRPMVYNGQGMFEAHSFIVCGYSSQLFYVNWGWDGECDGYFALTRLTPTYGADYSINQTAIIGIQSPIGSGDIDRPKAVVQEMTLNKQALSRANASEDFPSFTIGCTVVSDLTDEATIQLGLALYDVNGLRHVLSSTSHTFTNDEPYTYEAEINLMADLPQGNYTIKAINRMHDNDIWLSNSASSDRYIKLIIEDVLARLQVWPMTGEDKWTEEYGIHTIDGVTYHLIYEGGNYNAYVIPYNENEYYSGDIYIPDHINYANRPFHVFNQQGCPFIDCPELISLSIGFPTEVISCPRLKNLEIRQGVTQFVGISKCDELETVSYPKSMNKGSLPEECKNLKSIIINTNKQFSIDNYNNNFWNVKNMPSLTDVYLNSDFPPVFNKLNGDFDVNPNVTIHIPKGSLPAYKQSAWKNWNLQEDRPPISTCIEWDYCGSNPLFTWSDWSEGIGVGRGNNNVEFAMCIPAPLIIPYKGCRITKIEFHSPHLTDTDWHINDVEYVFVTKPGTDYLVKVPLITIRGAWNTVELPEPYVITGDSLFVGYGRNKALGADWANQDIVDEGFYLRIMGNDYSHDMLDEVGIWEKHAGVSDWNRSLPLRFFIEGENLPADVCISQASLIDQEEEQKNEEFLAQAPPSDKPHLSYTHQQFPNDSYFTISTGLTATPEKAASHHILEQVSGNHMQIQASVRSRTIDPINSLTFNWNIDNLYSGKQSFETNLIPNHEATFLIDLPTKIEGRNHRVILEVDEINGKPDEIKANSSDTTAFTLPATTHFPRRIVMEEVTGTWCGWCPRGIESIKLASEHYPDNFIAIGIHNDEEMYPVDASYDPILNLSQFSSVPNSLINRTTFFDPDWFSLKNLIEEVKDKGDATIEATAHFVNQDYSRINVTTQTTFGFNDNDLTDYRIAYVVLEDLVGPYCQTNFYCNSHAEDNSNDYMNFWRQSDYEVFMPFNNVARSIIPNCQGASGCFHATIKEGETYIYSYEFSLPENIQQKNKLRIVTLLIDGTTGEIMNAAQTPVIYDAEVGIDEHPTNRQPFNIYNLAGSAVRRQVTSLQGLRKGVYVINGKKIVVR